MPTSARTSPELCRRAALAYGTASAIEDGETRLTFHDVDRLRRQAARALIALGVAHGDRVAIWAPNVYEWVIAALGIHSVGGILVPLNTRMKEAEAGELLARSGTRVLFTIGRFLGDYYPDMLDAATRASLRHIIVLGEAKAGDMDWPAFMAKADGIPAAEGAARANAVTPDDICDILFTSGTTGHAKGVMCTHEQSWRSTELWSGNLGIRPGDRHLVIPPFFHSFGYKSGWVADLMRGATLLPHQVFDTDVILERLAREKISIFPGPPSVYQSLLAHPRLKEFDLSHLRAAITGSASIPPVLIERMRGTLGFKVVLTGYGLTESCGHGTVTQIDDDAETVATTSGRALPGIELRCVDENNQPVPPNQPGEIVIRGYLVMRGYFNDEAATREAIDADGWLHTGDIGMLDERGYLKIVDRLKDMYINGGFNCYPAEIERYLARHPAVAQVAVVGVPDERMGEVGRAYVVAKAGQKPDEAELIAWARGAMANYKVPRSVAFVDELPLNSSGKVLKRVLRERDTARGVSA